MVLISLLLFSLLAILGSGWWLYTANTLVELSYRLIDPRVKLE